MKNLPIIWIEDHKREKKRWTKFLVGTNVCWILICLFLYTGWLSTGFLSDQIYSLKQENKFYRVRNEILSVLRVKGVTLNQGLDIADALIAHSIKNGVPWELGLGIMKKESQFKVDAISNAGARGLMQLMPATFNSYNEKMNLNLPKSSISDPVVNIMISMLHLKDLIAHHKPKCRTEEEMWTKVLVAYSGGAKGYPVAVMRYQREYERIMRDGEI